MTSQYLHGNNALQIAVEPVLMPSTKLKGSSAICTKEALPPIGIALYRAGGCLDDANWRCSTKALHPPPPPTLAMRGPN
jgi:hypothetical protein